MLQQYQHILVPVDGSYEAELAFKKAVAVAKRNGPNASVHMVHVVDTRAFQNISSFDTTVAEAKADGLDNVDYSIEYGAPKTIIARDVPKDMGIDLIMIGATGLNAVERLLIGSVTEYVTRMAVCDVLVVRTDLENKPAPKPKKK
ncbi:universal stress protein [Lactiplantibacillus plantarum]|nr:universal stress protein [Lactiplantibacillus plantarum]